MSQPRRKPSPAKRPSAAARRRKRARRRRITALLICLALLAGAVGLFFALGGGGLLSGGPTQAITLSSDRPVYSEKEVKGAFSALRKYLKQEYPGIALTALSYDETVSTQRAAALAGAYPGREILIVNSTFSVSQEKEPFSPGRTYPAYAWVLTRETGGKWTVQPPKY